MELQPFHFPISHKMMRGQATESVEPLSGRHPNALEHLRMENSEPKRAVDPEWLKNELDKTLIKSWKSGLQSHLDCFFFKKPNLLWCDRQNHRWLPNVSINNCMKVTLHVQLCTIFIYAFEWFSFTQSRGQVRHHLGIQPSRCSASVKVSQQHN